MKNKIVSSMTIVVILTSIQVSSAMEIIDEARILIQDKCEKKSITEVESKTIQEVLAPGQLYTQGERDTCYGFVATYLAQALIQQSNPEMKKPISTLSILGNSCQGDLSTALKGGKALGTLDQLRNQAALIADRSILRIDPLSSYSWLDHGFLTLPAEADPDQSHVAACRRFLEPLVPADLLTDLERIIQFSSSGRPEEFHHRLAESLHPEKAPLPPFNIHVQEFKSKIAEKRWVREFFRNHPSTPLAFNICLDTEEKEDSDSCDSSHAMIAQGYREICCDGECEDQWLVKNSWGEDYSGWMSASILSRDGNQWTYTEPCGEGTTKECTPEISGANLSDLIQYASFDAIRIRLEKLPAKGLSQDEKEVSVLAALNGRTDVLEWIHSHRPELLSAVDKVGVPTLIKAAGNSHWGTYRRLLELDPSLRTQTTKSGIGLSHVLAQSGNLELLTEISQKYPDILLAQDRYGTSVPVFCALNDEWKIIEPLLELSPDSFKIQNEDHLYVTHIAAKTGKTAELIKILDRLPELIEKKTIEGETLATLAAAHQHWDTLESLLARYPILLTLTEDDGNSVLHHIAFHGNQALLMKLLRAHPELIHQTNNDGDTLAHTAASGKQWEILDELLKIDSTLLNQENHSRVTLAHHAAEHGNLPLLTRIQSTHPSLFTVKSNEGNTPLLSATMNDHWEIVDFILSNHPEGALINSPDGGNLAHMVAYEGNLPLFKKITQIAPQLLKGRGPENMTPAFYAGSRKHWEILDHIKQVSPESLEAKTTKGSGLLELAIEEGSPELIDWLAKNYPKALAKRGRLSATESDLLGYLLKAMSSKECEASALDLMATHYPKLFTHRTEEGLSFGHIAAEHENLKIIQQIKAIDPKPLCTSDHRGEYPLTIALNRHQSAPSIEGWNLVQELLSACSNEQKARLKKDGNNLAHLFAQQGRVSSVLRTLSENPQLLLEKDRKDQQTPAHVALSSGHIKTFIDLVRIEPRALDSLDSRGKRPLDLVFEAPVLDPKKVIRDLVKAIPDRFATPTLYAVNFANRAVSLSQWEVLKELARVAPATYQSEGRCGSRKCPLIETITEPSIRSEIETILKSKSK